MQGRYLLLARAMSSTKVKTPCGPVVPGNALLFTCGNCLLAAMVSITLLAAECQLWCAKYASQIPQL